LQPICFRDFSNFDFFGHGSTAGDVFSRFGTFFGKMLATFCQNCENVKFRDFGDFSAGRKKCPKNRVGQSRAWERVPPKKIFPLARAVRAVAFYRSVATFWRRAGTTFFWSYFSAAGSIF